MVEKKVRLYIGTRKGGYVAESDLKRKKWSVKGPFQAGKDVFHVSPDPRHPGQVYAAVNSPWVGPMLLRSTDHGRSWKEIPPPMMTVSKKRPPLNFDQGPPKHAIVNLWHVEPGPVSEPDTLFVGVDPASLFRSDDRGQSWSPVSGLNEHETRPKWNPGAGGLCLHTILLDPTRPKRMYVGISAAGTFRSDDAGDHWRPVNRGVKVSFMPEKFPEFGQCVHKVALDPSDPSIAYRQDHDGIYVSHDGMESWKHIGKPLPEDFGFVTAVSPAKPGQAYFVPLLPMERTAPKGRLQVYRWTERTKQWAPTIPAKGGWTGDLGTHREGLAIDGLDPHGIYLGTTTGQLIYSPDGDRHWSEIPYHFPGIHSVEVSTPNGSGR